MGTLQDQIEGQKLKMNVEKSKVVVAIRIFEFPSVKNDISNLPMENSSQLIIIKNLFTYDINITIHLCLFV